MKTESYNAGFNCGLNGPDVINCHPKYFRTREMTDEWEKGKKAGEKHNPSTQLN